MSSMSKIESRTVISEHGEVLTEENIFTTKFQSEPDYVKLYLDDIGMLNDLPKKANTIMLQLAKRMNYDGVVFVTTSVKKIISKECGCTEQHIANSINMLIRKGIIRRSCRSEYLFNPIYFGKGGWAEICKRRNSWIKVEHENGVRKITTSFSEEKKSLRKAG